MTALDRFGRRCLAWPAIMLGLGLTYAGRLLILGATWLMDIEMAYDEED